MVAELHVDEQRGDVVVRPPDEIDICTRPVLDLLLTQALALGPDHVVVDLASVRFLDRAAVDLILDTAATARARGSVLVVRRPNRQYLRLASLLPDKHLFELVERRDDAPDHPDHGEAEPGAAGE